MPNLPLEKNCFGCGACANICQAGAISMAPSARGFLVPEVNERCIGCNRCMAVCPSIHAHFDNDSKPDLYSLQADDEIRLHSTSGGVFTLLAEEILSRNGLVCGAVFDEQLRLHHVLTGDHALVMKMRGSKYVQSNTETCFREIKEALSNDRWVLFTGTPCQVAGLKTFLGKDYEKLLTADLICHGTPSQKALDMYLQDIGEGKTPINVEFRSKRFGWTWSHILITFSDGSEHVGDKSDPYKKGFSKRLLWRDTCADCRFARLPRQGDVTIGDLWGSKQLDPESMDGKGTSFVVVNNTRGKDFFRAIKARAAYCRNLEINNYEAIPNRLTDDGSVSHRYRERFLSMLGDYPFSRAIQESLNNHYDIAMPTGLYNLNLGGVLTYFMLFHTLKDMGYTVLNLAAPETASRKPWKPAVEFCERHLPYYAQPKRYSNVMQMREVNKHVDMFVLGSDQYLSESMSKEFDDIFFLNFAESSKPKIAVAASFGGKPLDKRGKEYVEEMKYYLNQFSAFSCREDYGVEFANNDLKLSAKASWVIDPIFLASPKYLYDLAEDKSGRGNYIGAYIILPNQSKWQLIDEVRRRHQNLPLRIIGHSNARKLQNEEYLTTNGFVAEESFPVENSLGIIKNCDFFVTDSFHGLCLALIFKKDFVVMPRDYPDRFFSLLRRLGLEDRILTNGDMAFNLDSLKPIDWAYVSQKLEALAEDGRTFIRNALRSASEKPLSDYDMVMREIVKQQQMIAELTKTVKALNKKISRYEKLIGRLKKTFIYKIYRFIKR